MFLFFYNLLLPGVLLLTFPAWLKKTKQRGGFHTGISERWGIFHSSHSEIKKGSIYIHAVSVGEALIAKKLLTQWLEASPDDTFTLAVSTPTAKEAINNFHHPRLQKVYNSIDLFWVVQKFLDRYAPKILILMESELWPNLITQSHNRGIPVAIANARLSENSEKNLKKLSPLTQTLLAKINWLGAQTTSDAERWASTGILKNNIQVTGSIKFDSHTNTSKKQPISQNTLTFLQKITAGKPIICALSTHTGEEKIIAQAAQKAGAFPLIIPRHAERRHEVVNDLKSLNINSLLKTNLSADLSSSNELSHSYQALVLDTTGEIMDWLPHAKVAVIGKSFLAEGGQNPVEPILCNIPTIVGPHMNNFKELVQELTLNQGVIQTNTEQLSEKIATILNQPKLIAQLMTASREVIQKHSGATQRTINELNKLA